MIANTIAGPNMIAIIMIKSPSRFPTSKKCIINQIIKLPQKPKPTKRYTIAAINNFFETSLLFFLLVKPKINSNIGTPKSKNNTSKIIHK